MTFHIDLHRQAMALKRRLGPSAAYLPSRLNCWPLLRRGGALLAGETQGSSLVEISLALPVLLTLFTGICAFAVAFNNQLTLTSAVGTGGQYLQLIRTSSTDPCADTVTAIQNAAPTLKTANMTLSFNLNGTVVTANTCPGDQAYLVQGQPVSVTATYPCTLAVYGMKFSACQLSAKVTEYEY